MAGKAGRRQRTKEDAEEASASKKSQVKISGEEKKKRGKEVTAEVEVFDSDSDSSSESEGEESGTQTWLKAGRKGKSPEKSKVRYICKGGDVPCNKVIKRKEKCIECEACEKWFHFECQGLSQGAFQAIREHNLFWVCGECQRRFVEMQNIRKQVKADIERVEGHVVNKVEEVKSMVEKVIDKKVNDGLKKMETKFGESSTELKKAVREKNLRPRLLLVKLETAEDAESLLMKRFGLRDAGYPNVYITRDLSKEEREKQWKLREELKKKGRDTHKIFRGRVIPREH